MKNVNITSLAADLASRIPEMARDSASDNAVVIENLLRERLNVKSDSIQFEPWKTEPIFGLGLPVEVVCCHEHAKVPQVAGKGNAGYDVHSPDYAVLPPCSHRVIKTGLKIAVPDGYYIRIAGRSGLAAKGVSVLGGVVDPSYRGEIGVILANHSSEPISISRGDRIAQFVFEKYHLVGFTVTSELSETSRGEKGFGSTGK